MPMPTRKNTPYVTYPASFGACASASTSSHSETLLDSGITYNAPLTTSCRTERRPSPSILAAVHAITAQVAAEQRLLLVAHFTQQGGGRKLVWAMGFAKMANGCFSQVGCFSGKKRPFTTRSARRAAAAAAASLCYAVFFPACFYYFFFFSDWGRTRKNSSGKP